MANLGPSSSWAETDQYMSHEPFSYNTCLSRGVVPISYLKIKRTHMKWNMRKEVYMARKRKNNNNEDRLH